jgi:tRNA pseudouridine55 synthase
MHKNMREDISGVLLLNKDVGISSNNILQKVKYLFRAKKAGHTGTLDPMARGLLPICFGDATKFANYLLESDKEYIAKISLGTTTTTYDLEGEVVEQKNTDHLSPNDIYDAVVSFVGEIRQTPPIYSAIKLKGRPLYKYALANLDVVVPSRMVWIKKIDILDFTKNIITIQVQCSKGTYIRSLAHDIGQKLGVGAYLVDLERTKTNSLDIHNSIKLADIEPMTDLEKLNILKPIDYILEYIHKIEINEPQYNKIKHGNFIIIDDIPIPQKEYRIYYNNVFLGIGVGINNNKLQPVRLIKNLT